MTTYVVASGEVESAIREMFLDQLGTAFSGKIIGVMATMVSAYNRTESVEMIDAVIESVGHELTDYSPVDAFVEQFVRLVEAGIDPRKERAELEYFPLEEAIVVTPVKRPAPKPSIKIKEEYRHAEAQGDFYPERLRRAFEELISSGI